MTSRRTPSPGRDRGRMGWVAAASVLTGLALATAAVAVPLLPERTSILTGAVLVAFALGWLVLARLSARLTGHPQRWAYAPAAFFGLAAVVAFIDSTRLDAIFGWVWPVALFVLSGWIFIQVRRHMPSRPGRFVLYPLIIVLGLASISGGLVAVRDTIHRSSQATTMPGKLVDLGDHRLHLHCTGSGAPTVIIEPGLGGSSSEVHWITAAVRRDTRVCAYDRAGRGWSEIADEPQDAAHIATDLHKLLDHADVPGPYVFAGHSFGGLYSLTFAAQFPDQVAGVVLLDSSSPTYDRPSDDPAGTPVSRLATLMPSLGAVVGGRELGSFAQEFLDGSASVHQAAALTLRDKPLVVVTADTGHDATWFSDQQRLARLSTNSDHRIVHATHQSLVIDEATSAAASDAIHDVIVSVRTSQRLRPR